MSAQENLLNNRYQLLAQHGSGGMSVIYRATDLALGRQVAVKILRPSLTGDPAFLQRFRQEARNVANLQHPNIVTVHDVGQDGNTHYIVMELVEGSDLKKLIRAEAPFDIDRVLEFAIQICAGIGYAHRAGLVHADVKPQNVLLTDNLMVKITDFGIARALASTQAGERQKVVWGSPHYFSPEQAQGKYPTPASDVYSIGIVLFEMLTGRLPFMGNDQQELAMAHIRTPAPSMRDFNAVIPDALDAIVQKVLTKEPGGRYSMAEQLGRILTTYREQGAKKTGEQPPVARASSYEDSESQFPADMDSEKSPADYRQEQESGQIDDESSAGAAAVAYEHRHFAPPGVAVAPPSPGSAAPPTLQQPRYADPTMTSPRPTVPAADSSAYYTPDGLRDLGYYSPGDPPGLDAVTLTLGFIAFLAVMGMVILWIFVFQAYYSG